MATKKPQTTSFSYEITCSYGGKFNVGNYEQETNLYSIKELISSPIELTREDIMTKQIALASMCREMFESDKASIKKQPANIIEDAKTIFNGEELKDRDLEKKMTYISLISQASSPLELECVGKEIAAKATSFSKTTLDEIRKEYNAKMKSLKGNV